MGKYGDKKIVLYVIITLKNYKYRKIVYLKKFNKAKKKTAYLEKLINLKMKGMN